jgi:hypothetical protein
MRTIFKPIRTSLPSAATRSRYPSIRRIRELPPLAGSAALGDQPANDRHRGYGREFRRGWPGGPVFLLRSTVRTLPMAKSVAFLAANESIGLT